MARAPLQTLLLALALMGVLLLVPHEAQAHVEPAPHLLQRVEQGLVFSALLETDLLLEREEVLLHVNVVHFDTGQHPQPLRLEATVEPTAAPGLPNRVALEPAEPGHFRARVNFSAAGEHVLRLRDVDADVEVVLPFEVYPQPAHRFGWAGLRAPTVVAGEPARLTFVVVDAHGAPLEPVPEGVVEVERWTNDGERRLDLQRATLQPTGVPGELEVVGLRLDEGHHLLWVGVPALGLPPSARPPLPLYAHAPEPSAELEAPASVPGPAAPFALMGALIAVAARAMAGGGRRRGS